ncbi:hypothetical protein tb265_19230 [Gemmatimonadetes bacterium T265]|nr:hypothetical protein tb265_19230 [Gemmatimonadetes bacterium T265]
MAARCAIGHDRVTRLEAPETEDARIRSAVPNLARKKVILTETAKRYRKGV